MKTYSYQDEVNDYIGIESSIEGESVSASVCFPRSMEMSLEEMVDVLSDRVWWISREELQKAFNYTTIDQNTALLWYIRKYR